MKWLWESSNDNKDMWGSIIKAKYEESDSWMTKEVTTAYGVSLWKSIRELWNEFKPNTKIKVLGGIKTRFWKDDCHAKGNMKTPFPNIHNLVLQQQSTTAHLWTPQGWNFVFRRHLNDRKIPRVTDLFRSIDRFSGLETGHDRLQWLGNSTGIFKVGTAYGKLNHQICSYSNGPGDIYGKPRSPTRCLALCDYWLKKQNLKTSPSPCLGEFQRLFIAGKKQGHKQKTEGTGELSLPLFGGQYGKRGTISVFDNKESSMQQVKLNCIWTLCFWCNQIYSNDTLTNIDVLDSL
ncbi:hypothetical protein H5410_053020 [Solanum commersonii]|uniref:Uncharacterized protein n=1 Tax=Solanum commersonii TaxID=4109 RepID=A0A9J5X2D6_SOLCO|nr:hypothetical protein H5410_053020 [Solanum commersonii]